MSIPSSPRQHAPDLLLVLGLTAFVAGLSATAASLAPSAPRPIMVHAAGTDAARRDWRARPARAVAAAHPASAALTRDLVVPHSQKLVAWDFATPRPLMRPEMAARACAGLSLDATPQPAEPGDFRGFLARTALAARTPKVVVPMGVPSVSALDAHVEARMMSGMVRDARSGDSVSKASEVVTSKGFEWVAARRSTSRAQP